MESAIVPPGRDTRKSDWDRKPYRGNDPANSQLNPENEQIFAQKGNYEF